MRVAFAKKPFKHKYAPSKVPMLIPQITPHMLRHTFATLLYLSGVDVLEAKEQLGHKDVQTIWNIYTHLDSSHKKKSLSKLDEYLKASAIWPVFWLVFFQKPAIIYNNLRLEKV